MSGVTQEQIARAKAVPLLDYLLAHEGGNWGRVGSAYYRRDPDHNSLRVDNNLWYWHSRGIGGDIIDYLVKINGYSFVDAVLHLTGDAYPMPVTPKAGPPTIMKPKAREPFRPPARNADNRRVIEYLQGRGIDKAIIGDCIHRGSLYESGDGWHSCVFVGRDESGRGRFAAIRGTTGGFKRDANGSDKRYGFVIPPKNPVTQTAACFESPIDAMSHACLSPGFDGWRLSLGGTALIALEHFLERHGEVKAIVVCTDSDEAGNQAAARIAELQGHGLSVTRGLPPDGENDWNAALKQIRNEVNTMQDLRKDIRFIDSGYNELFRVKDGDSIKLTSGYDGEIQNLKCRFIDEAHLTLTGKYRNDYHICELAEILERNGSKCEPIPGQKPALDVIAAKYGEALQDVTIPMTEAAIRKLVGGSYKIETLNYPNRTEQIKDRKVEIKGKAFGAIVRGKDGIAVLGLGGPNNDKLTSLHPYNAQSKKRELSPAARAEPEAETLLDELANAKAEVVGRADNGDRTARLRPAEAR
jgi:hypothetical protein